MVFRLRVTGLRCFGAVVFGVDLLGLDFVTFPWFAFVLIATCLNLDYCVGSLGSLACGFVVCLRDLYVLLLLRFCDVVRSALIMLVGDYGFPILRRLLFRGFRCLPKYFVGVFGGISLGLVLSFCVAARFVGGTC